MEPPRDAIDAWSLARRRVAWTGLCLLGLSFAVFALTAARSSINPDVEMSNFASWQLATHGTPWIDHTPVPENFHIATHNIWVVHTANGHIAIARFPGVVIAGLPAYLIAHSSTTSIAAGGLTAALLTAVSVTLIFASLAHQVRQRLALAGAVAFGFSTPIWSVAADGLWPHTVTVLGIAGMAWASSSRRWWCVGMFGGVALFGRINAALIVAVLGLLIGWQRREIGIVIRVALSSLTFLFLDCAWVYWVYGSWNPAQAYGPGSASWHLASPRIGVVNQLGMWVSPDRGLLVWTPVILVLIPALLRSWKSLPDWSRSLLIAGFVYTVVQAALNTTIEDGAYGIYSFTGGARFYGYRYGLEMLACATPALVMAAPRLGRVGKALVGPILAVQCLAISLGATFSSPYLPFTAAWRHNAFLSAVSALGLVGWLSVVVAAGVGIVAWRVLAPRSAADRPAPSQEISLGCAGPEPDRPGPAQAATPRSGGPLGISRP